MAKSSPLYVDQASNSTSGVWAPKHASGTHSHDSGMYSHSVHDPTETTPLLSPSLDFDKKRWRSIRVMYLTMFVGSVGFTILLPSIWPFLREVDHCVTTDFLGYVVAAYSVGQFVGSPVFGFVASRTSAKWPLLISLVITFVGNVMYAFSGLLKVHSHSNGVFMLSSRLLVGIGAGCVSVARAYVSDSTTMEERTSAMASMSASQSLGFIIGPALASAFSPIGKVGTTLPHINLDLNMYTAPALLAAFLAFVNIIIIGVFFKEHSVDNALKTAQQDSIINSSERDYDKIDYVAAGSCIYLFFIIMFMFSVFETILSPFSMDELDWSGQEAALYNGIMFLAAGALSIVVFIAVKKLAQRYSERALFLVGLLICAVAFVAYQPIGPGKPTLAPHGNGSSGGNSTFEDHVEFSSSLYSEDPVEALHSSHDTRGMSVAGVTPLATWASSMMDSSLQAMHKGKCDPVHDSDGGCPIKYDWCLTLPKVYLVQMLVGCFFVALGYPVCAVMAYTIFSKILGPKPQGTMMGLLTGAGSGARILGPVFISNVYASFGPRVAFACVSGIVLASAVFLLIVYRRLVPHGTRRLKTTSLQ